MFRQILSSNCLQILKAPCGRKWTEVGRLLVTWYSVTMHVIKFQITFSSAVRVVASSSSFSHDPKHPQIGVQNSRMAASRLSPAPPKSCRTPWLAAEGFKAQFGFSEAFPCPRRIYLAVEGLDTNLACLSGGLCCCWGAVHELLVVCLTLMAAILLCLTQHFHLFMTQTG